MTDTPDDRDKSNERKEPLDGLLRDTFSQGGEMEQADMNELRRTIFERIEQPDMKNTGARKPIEKLPREQGFGLLNWAALLVLAVLVFAVAREFSSRPAPQQNQQVNPAPEQTLAGAEFTPQAKAELLALIKELSGDDFDGRNAAQKKIEALIDRCGPSALAFLKNEALPEARKRGDMETVSRLSKIVRNVTAPHVVQAYATGPWEFHMDPRAPIVMAELVAQVSKNGLTVFDAARGTQLWSHGGFGTALGNSIVHSRAAYADGLLFAYSGTNSQGFSGYVPQTGQARWGSEFPKNPGQPDAMIFADPTLNLVCYRAHPGNYRVFETSGNLRWTAQIPNAHSTIFENGIMAVGVNEPAAIVALNPKTGKTLWRKEFTVPEYAFIRPLAANGGFVFASDLERISCLDAVSGREVWQLVPQAPVLGTEERQHVTQMSMRGFSGTFNPEICPDAQPNGVPLLAASADVVVSSAHAFLFGSDVKTGRQLWSVPCIRMGESSFVERDGVVYAGSDRGEIIAVRAKDGKVLFRTNLNNDERAADAPKHTITRGKEPPRSEIGTVAPGGFIGETLFVSTSSGWVVGLKLPLLPAE